MKWKKMIFLFVPYCFSNTGAEAFAAWSAGVPWETGQDSAADLLAWLSRCPGSSAQGPDLTTHIGRYVEPTLKVDQLHLRSGRWSAKQWR